MRLVTLPLVLIALPIADYGLLQLAVIFRICLDVFLGNQITVGSKRGIANNLDGTFLYALYYRFRIFLITLPVAALFLWAIYLAGYPKLFWMILIITIGFVFGEMPRDSVKNYFFAKKRFRAFAILDSAIVIASVLASTIGAILTGSVIVFALAEFIAVAFISLFSLLYLGVSEKLFLAYRKKEIDRKVIDYGLKMIPGTTVLTFSDRFANIFVTVFFGLNSLAIFSVVEKMHKIFKEFLNSTNDLLYADFSKARISGLIKTTKLNLKKGLALSFSIVLFFTILAYFYIDLFLPADYQIAKIYILILALSLPPIIPQGIIQTILEVNFKHRDLTGLIINSNLVKIIIILVLGLFFGIWGVLAGLVLGNWAMLFFYYFTVIARVRTDEKKLCVVAASDIAIRFLLFGQLKRLKEDGFDISVVCSEGKWTDDIREAGFVVKPIKITRKISPFTDLLTLFQLRKYFKKERFNIVHTHTLKPGLLGLLAARLAGVPIVVHSNLGLYFKESSPWFKKEISLFFERIVACLASTVFFVARPNLELALKKKVCSKNKAKYLGGWVNLEKFNPDRFSENSRLSKKKELGISGDRVIGINARLVRDKGYLELLPAFAELLKEFPKTTLLIIGTREKEKADQLNPDKIFAEFGIEKKVCFLTDRTDIPELYAVMDLFVLPSYREGIAISVLEALAMKVPTIASKVGGVVDSVIDKETGLLIKAEDKEDLKRALIWAMKNESLMKGYALIGRRKIEKEFKESLVYDRLNQEYSRLIKLEK